MGCSPWGREESDMTEQLPFHFSLSCIGEGNGNPLQCYDLQSRKRKIMARKGERFSQDHQRKFVAKSSCEKEADNEENLDSTHIYPGPEL